MGYGDAMQSFGASDDGKSISLCENEQFELSLDETPTTGFRWNLAQLPPILVLDSNEFVPPSTARPGAGGVRRLLFRACGPGDGQLALNLEARRPPIGQPRVFTVNVTVSR